MNLDIKPVASFNFCSR